MFKRIFVPLDGGAAALAAARWAARLARASRAQLRACYVVDETLVHAARGLVDLRTPLRGELEAEGRRALGKIERLCTRMGVACSVRIVEGRVAEQILLAARRFRADLMVVGPPGPGGLRALLRGSRVPTLLRSTTCPVLVLPARSTRRGARTRRH
jgi:nucleotide-binding universal stress UspA family protein